MLSKEATVEEFRILLIEDNPADCDLVIEMLDTGARTSPVVSIANRMADAAKKLSTDTFDLVLLDLKLPDASGLDAVKMIREIASDVPVIVLTGIEDEFLALSCINRGAQDYLCKGEIKPVTLRRSIDHAITRARETQMRAQLSAQLQQAQKMEALGTLAGGIAHDFNNSLAIILGNSEILIEDLPAESETLLSALEIRKAALFAKDLVGRILSFSRSHEPKTVPTAISNVVSEALQLISHSIPKPITIQSDIPPGLPMVSADPAQLTQVLVNLCANAAQAIGNRTGVIRIESDTVLLGPGAGIPGTEVQTGHFVRVTVSDDGPGMSEATVTRAFEPFFTTKAVGEGSGLGLAIVHSVMISHHGAVTLESQPGFGATFQLYFPCSENAEMREKTLPSPVHGNGKHLLFVDDDESLIYLIPRRLRRMGFRVTAHSEAKEAIEDFRQRPDEFDAVVSDYNMPTMSGSELVRQVNEIRPGMPTIVTSGFIRDEDALASQAAGAHALIGKPSSIEEMAVLIIEVLSKSELGD